MAKVWTRSAPALLRRFLREDAVEVLAMGGGLILANGLSGAWAHRADADAISFLAGVAGALFGLLSGKVVQTRLDRARGRETCDG